MPDEMYPVKILPLNKSGQGCSVLIECAANGRVVKQYSRSNRRLIKYMPAPWDRYPWMQITVSADVKGSRPKGRSYCSARGALRRIPVSLSCSADTTPGALVSGQLAVCVFGNAMTSRMLSAPAINITIRSRPNATPPPRPGAPDHEFELIHHQFRSHSEPYRRHVIKRYLDPPSVFPHRPLMAL